jgi:hypothetical protein
MGLRTGQIDRNDNNRVCESFSLKKVVETHVPYIFVSSPGLKTDDLQRKLLHIKSDK